MCGMLRLRCTSLLLAAIVLFVLFVPARTVSQPVEQASRQETAGDTTAAFSEDGLVRVTLTVDVPRCRYRRADKRTQLRSNITFAGVDARVRAIVGDSVVQLSHHNLARHDVEHDRDGSIVEKSTPDTTCSYELSLAWDQTIDIAVVTYCHPGRRFIQRDRVKPVGKSSRIPADFNRGRPIDVRVTIDSNGDIIFKYW